MKDTVSAPLPARPAYQVVFRTEENRTVQRDFDSEYLCRRFVNKLKHSKRCTLVYAPLFR